MVFEKVAEAKLHSIIEKGRVGATLEFDWEMTTIGDPLMDLGSTLAYWVEPADSKSLKEYAFGPTMVPGSMSRRDLVSRYVHPGPRACPKNYCASGTPGFLPPGAPDR